MATFSESIAAIQDGSAYKPPPSVDDLASIGTPSSQSAVESITNLWAGAADNLPKALSVTSTQVKVIELKAKSEGREPTEAELDEACGPLSFLTSVPRALNEALGGILESVSQFASDFGESIGAFAARLNQLTEDLANAIESGIQELIDAAETALGAVNQAAIQALNAVENAINTAVGFVNDILTEAENLLNKAIDELISFARGLNFSSIFSLDCQEEALENTIDTDKIADAEEINRVITPEVFDVAPAEEITPRSLSEPQTTFETPETTPPSPSLEQLIERYRIAARSLRSANEDIAAANAEGRSPPFTRTQLAELTGRVDAALQDLNVAALAAGKNTETLPIYGRNFDSPQVASTAGRTQNASTARPTVGDDYEQAESREARIQQFIQETRSQIAQFNRINEATFEIIQNTRRSGEPINGDLAAGINIAIKQNEDLRARIIRNIDALPPDVAPRVRQAVGPVPPVLR